MTHTHAPRRGFSLIEIMVVIAIVSLLMTISAGAFVRYFVNARQRATEAMMTIVDDAVAQRYESYWKKVDPPIRTRHAVMAGLGVTSPPSPVAIAPTNEPQHVRLRRAKLLAKLEGMRGDFPQQFADFLPGASGGLATCTDTAAPMADNASAVASRARTAIEAEYRRLTYDKNPTLVPNNAPRGSPGYNQVTQIAPHSHQTEAAACLYLILKVTSAEGRTFDMGSIPASFVRDTDEDGVPEIVDSWGTPVRFYRWPTDLLHSFATVSGQLGGGLNVLDAGNSNNQNTLDPERLLYTVPWIATTASQDFERNTNTARAGMGNFFRLTDPTAANRTPFSYPMYPVIISAGKDAAGLSPEDKWQAFGLMWGTDPNTIPTSYITTSWPPVDDLQARMAKISSDPDVANPYPTLSTAYPGAGMHSDNIFSRVIVAGREAQ